MTTGEPLVVRVAMKPISTLMRPLGTVDVATGEAAARDGRAQRRDRRAGDGRHRRGDGGVRAGGGVAREVRRRLARRDAAELSTATFRTSTARRRLTARAIRRTPHLVLVGLPGSREEHGRAGCSADATRPRRSSTSIDEIERREGRTVSRDLRGARRAGISAQLERDADAGAVAGRRHDRRAGRRLDRRSRRTSRARPAPCADRLPQGRVPETALKRLGVDGSRAAAACAADPLEARLDRCSTAREPLYESGRRTSWTRNSLRSQQVIERLARACLARRGWPIG